MTRDFTISSRKTHVLLPLQISGPLLLCRPLLAERGECSLPMTNLLCLFSMELIHDVTHLHTSQIA